MSLIQAALDKTQNKISTAPEKKQAGAKPVPHADALKSLGALDREIEQKIQAIPHKELPKIETAPKSPFVLFILLVLLFVSGVLYWSQNRMVKIEPEPPLVVDIERHIIPSKPELALPKTTARVIPPVVLSPTDSRGLFFLSGIATGGAQPYAVINGQILRSGEMVEKKALIQSIEKDHVILTYRGETIQLTLKR